ncbi:hypothetical protein MSVAZ_2349 [Methanosarcina vacuolata Z-761]|uniref:Uncharacterized protein n=1 Tax=Methanosarcina vacuolata Z-761 TaxID=1434123 RepID=A0A0E3Q707_9EURY|nr:hypothetical protein MSVAZ_2349 [Methanosarcina vacuolata Z-761]
MYMKKQYFVEKLVELLNKYLSDKIPFFVTDGLNLYKEVLLKHFGVLRECPRTGKGYTCKRGRNCGLNCMLYVVLFKSLSR